MREQEESVTLSFHQVCERQQNEKGEKIAYWISTPEAVIPATSKNLFLAMASYGSSVRRTQGQSALDFIDDNFDGLSKVT